MAAAGIVVVALSWWSSRAPAPPRVYETTRGQTARVHLSDGSEVVLGPASRLTVPPDDYRRATLDGEAVFHVRHVPAHPFVVAVRGVTIRVLGTEFTVRPLGTLDETRVAVRSGRVSLTAPARAPVTVDAGQSLAWTANRAVVTDDTALVAAEFAWMESRLEWRDEPLNSVAARLSRWLDRDVAVDDSALGARRVTATLVRPSIAAVRSIIAPVVEATLVIDGDRYVFVPLTSSHR
jgi:transmembrane sensor